MVALNGLVSAVVVAAALLAYDRGFARPGRAIGIVDLNAVYRQKEAEFTQRIASACSDAEREHTLEAARVFARRLPPALESLPQACRCLVVLRSAIAAPAPDTIDLTPELQRRLDRD